MVSELGKLSSFHSETYSSEFSMTPIQNASFHFAAPGSFQCPQSAWSTALPRGRSKAGRFDSTKPGVPKLLGADATFPLGFCVGNDALKLCVIFVYNHGMMRITL